MTKIIQEYEAMNKEKVVQKKRVLHHSLTKQEREERELFNRRDSYKPIKLNTEDFFCPREPLKTQKDYINERFAIESAAHKYSDNEESVVKKTKSRSQSARQASRMDSSIEETFQTVKKSNGVNIFGDNIFDSNCSSFSGVSEQSRDLGQLYTDEEIEMKLKKSPKVKKAEATPENDSITYLNPTHFLSDTKLRKKNGSLGLAEKIVHNKMVVFFFGAYWSSSSREVTQLLREVHSTLKVCKESFEVIYVSYDNSAAEYDRYIKEYHGDWACIEFESKKEELIKEMFPKICVPGLVVVRAEGTIITTRGLEDLMIYNKKPSSLYKLWKEQHLYKQPVDQKGASKFVSEATRKFGHLEQMTNDKDQVSIKNLEAKQFITKKKEDKGPQNQVTLVEKTINTGSYEDFGIPSRRIITNNSKRNKEVLRNIVNSTTILTNNTAKKYNQPDLSEDIEALPMKDLFMQFIKYHVFLHRSIEGASKRYWSRMQQGLEPPFNLPHIIIGDNWTEILVEKVPCLQKDMNRDALSKLVKCTAEMMRSVEYWDEVNDLEGEILEKNIKGTVKFYSDNKKFGFIRRDDGKGDILALKRHLNNPNLILNSGQRVIFHIKQQHDKKTAIEINLLE